MVGNSAAAAIRASASEVWFASVIAAKSNPSVRNDVIHRLPRATYTLNSHIIFPALSADHVDTVLTGDTSKAPSQRPSTTSSRRLWLASGSTTYVTSNAS